MKATELRIGNYVNLYGSIATVQRFDFNDRPPNGLAIDEGKPIPLTEQWLKDFGFEQFGNYKIYNKGDFQIDKTAKEQKEEGYWFFINEYPVNIVYVHQLQNLYFTLTNEELTKK